MSGLFLCFIRVNVGEQNIRVSMNIPPGYLGYENLGMGKGVSMPQLLICMILYSNKGL